MSLKRTRAIDPCINSRLTNFACKRCRSRKVKCDAEYPSCAGCSRANVPCIVADYSTGQDFTRADVNLLEEELAELEARLAATTNPADGAIRQPQRSPGALRFVGPESGVQFIQPIVDAMRRQGHHSLQRQEPLIEFHAPHHLPDFDVTQQAVKEYFREFHVAHPVLSQAEIVAMVEKIYSNLDVYRNPTSTLSKTQKHELFQLNMVLAIGGIRLHRDGRMTHHPFGFFTAALEANPPSEYGFCTIEDVECLLLIGLFGLFYNIGCSIWELGRLCVRICIELKLHETPPGALTTEMQRGRIMFWKSYLLDRFASSMLGRPYAIDDAMIDGDASRELAGDAFSHLVRMGQITSDMHTSIFYPVSGQASSFGTVKPIDSKNLFSTLGRFHSQLNSWRQQAVFEYPSCVYETPDFFELTFQEARLWLFRAAINNLSTGLPNIREKLLLLCLQAAESIITCFDKIGLDNLATRTRSSTRLILMSGLTIVFVLRMHTSRPPTIQAEHGTSDVDIEFWLEDLGLDPFSQSVATVRCRETIEVAGKILSGLATRMPDVAAYAQFFDILKTEVERMDSYISGGASRISEAEVGITTSATGFNSSINNTRTNDFQPEQFYSHELAHQHGELNALALSIHEQGAAGTMSLDDLLSGMLQGDHLVNTNDSLFPISDQFWSVSNASWMNEIDGDISGFIWDTTMPWQGSPFANT